MALARVGRVAGRTISTPSATPHLKRVESRRKRIPSHERSLTESLGPTYPPSLVPRIWGVVSFPGSLKTPRHMNRDNSTDGLTSPPWVSVQLSMFSASTNVNVRFIGNGQPIRFDCFAKSCAPCQAGACPRHNNCLRWFDAHVQELKQLPEATAIKCPNGLEYIWVPVTRQGESYGYLATEPILLTDQDAAPQRTNNPAPSSREEPDEHRVNGQSETQALRSVLHVKSAKRSGVLLLIQLVAQRLADLFHEESRFPSQLSPSESLVSRAKQLINDHYREDISTRDIAKSIHVSESHLCHAFQSVSGSTLREYLNDLRFKEACRLLRERSQLSISEAAFAAGFQSLSRFYEQFRSRNLPSPGTWRRTHAGAA